MAVAPSVQTTRISPRTRSLIAGAPMFGDLAQADLDRILSVSREQPMRSSERLMTAGDAGTSAMIILEGEVDVFLADGQGRDRVICALGRGAVVGEMSLFDGRPRSAHVIARTNGRLLVVESEPVRCLLDADPGFALAVINVLCGRLRNTLAQLDALQFRDIAARLASALLSLADGRDPRRVDMTQSALGDLVGATREMVNKRLRAFAAEGLISLQPGRVTLLDEPRLARAAAKIARHTC